MATEMPSHGSVVLPEDLPHGVLAPTTVTITKAAAAVVVVAVAMVAVEALAVLHRGLAIDVNATMTTKAAIPIMVGRTTVTEVPPLPVQRRGSNPLGRRLHTEAMLVVMLVATPVALWARLRVWVDHLGPLVLEHLLHQRLIT